MVGVSTSMLLLQVYNPSLEHLNTDKSGVAADHSDVALRQDFSCGA